MQCPSSFVTFVVAVEMLMLSVISSYSQGVEYNTHSRNITLSKSYMRCIYYTFNNP